MDRNWKIWQQRQKNAENRHMKKVTGFLMFIESFAASVEYWAVAAPRIPSTALVCRCRGPVDLEWRAKPNDGSNKGIMVVVAIGHHYLINKTPCNRGGQKMTTG